MKIRISFQTGSTFLLTLLLFTGSCKKDYTGQGQPSNANELQVQADDQSMISDESDNLNNDVNTALSSQIATNGNAQPHLRQSGTTAVNGTTVINGVSGEKGALICDATVVFDTVSNPRTITITYDGTNCWGNRKRSGTLIVAIAAGVHWRDVGATVLVVAQDLKITRVRDNKSIVINGVKKITNLSGGSLTNLASLGSITHAISDSISVLFDDSTSRSWRAEKKREFTYDNGMVITTTGNYSDNLHVGIAEWGTNRFGQSFTTIITEAIIFRQDCDFRLTSGQAEIVRGDDIISDITFGLDVSGNKTGCPGAGHYYLQVIWMAANGKSYPIIIPY